MSRTEAWIHNAANVLVGGTGLVYAIFLYAMRPDDPYAVVNHPWQPQVQHLHVLLAPLLVFAAGMTWQGHALPRLRGAGQGRGGRISGIAMLATLVPMVSSGYLLQTALDPSWRTVWAWIHLGASGLWLAAWLVHILRPERRLGAGG